MDLYIKKCADVTSCACAMFFYSYILAEIISQQQSDATWRIDI